MTITTIDRQTCKLLAAEIEAALQTVAAKHGVKITSGGGTIGATEFVCKVQVTLTGEAMDDAARAQFVKYAELYGLKPEYFGRTFTSGGKSYKVAGLALNRSAKPVKITRADGVAMITTVESVVRAFA